MGAELSSKGKEGGEEQDDGSGGGGMAMGGGHFDYMNIDELK